MGPRRDVGSAAAVRLFLSNPLPEWTLRSGSDPFFSEHFLFKDSRPREVHDTSSVSHDSVAFDVAQCVDRIGSIKWYFRFGVMQFSSAGDVSSGGSV